MSFARSVWTVERESGPLQRWLRLRVCQRRQSAPMALIASFGLQSIIPRFDLRAGGYAAGGALMHTRHPAAALLSSSRKTNQIRRGRSGGELPGKNGSDAAI